jgi:hypothetical protein
MGWTALGMILGEVASWCLYLVTKPIPCTGVWHVAVRRGDRAYLLGVILSCHCSRQWRLSREGKLPGRRYLMESLSVLIPGLLIITHGKSFLPGGAFPLAGSRWLLGVFLWSSDVRRQWDEFHTQVCNARCVWIPTATSLHARRLRQTLPMARGERCLSVVGKPLGTFWPEARVHALGGWERWEGLTAGEILFACAKS